MAVVQIYLQVWGRVPGTLPLGLSDRSFVRSFVHRPGLIKAVRQLVRNFDLVPSDRNSSVSLIVGEDDDQSRATICGSRTPRMSDFLLSVFL